MSSLLTASYSSRIACIAHVAAFTLCTAVHAAPITASAPPPSDDLLAQARAAAYGKLTELLRQNGLSDPEIVLTVAPPRTPAPTCAKPFSFQFADTRQLGRMLLTARCPATGTATQLVVRGTVTANLPVAVNDIAAGRAIAADDLSLQARKVVSLADTVTRIDDAVGQASRRAIRSGHTLSRKSLQVPELVRKGQSVRIVVRLGESEISSAGVALQAGGTDAIIPVRNASSGKEIRARVTGPGTVTVTDLPGSASPTQPSP
ncbi:flagellar basal body P-ring formation chaperone FlgA [Pandoraea pulmonicola]|nr:flagellar basal body P-ring formation chaperone FlgA [Pandoraea pulmonicola]APD13733.1 flagella basal body P-ring formation protein FlgA [Pandoraea pulmonicola]